ncbi:MAG: PQQ-binding-like beta-propeller repeat protein, partial [Thermoanaerobaculia bacterium]|nr:PQQ-binding-like beta-propeller repeat protein [Thermoanaerobaculia bacterium]
GVVESSGLPIELTPAGASWTREAIFGRSSPIVSRGLVFLTGLDGDALTTVAYRAATGDELWRRSVPRLRVDELASETGPAVATPVADDKSVYAFFPEFGLVAYDREGNERWRLELPPFSSYYGLAASPILESGVLVLLCDQSRDPYIVGVDAASGEELWRRRREVDAESWTTPVVHRPGTGAARVLTFGTFYVDAYDPRTGEVAWRLPGLGPTPVASPIVDGDRLYVVAPDQQETSEPPTIDYFAGLDTSGDGALDEAETAGTVWETTMPWLDIDDDGLASLEEIATQLEIMKSPDYGLVAIDLAAAGGPEIAWRQRKTLPYIASPIVYRGVMFLVKDGGILTSYDPASGEVLKRGRIKGAVEPFFPSPIATDGKLYLTSSVGTVAVVRAQAQWETLAVSDLDEQIFASPAVAEGRLFVRTRTKLYAYAGD